MLISFEFVLVKFCLHKEEEKKKEKENCKWDIGKHYFVIKKKVDQRREGKNTFYLNVICLYSIFLFILFI